MPNVFNSLIPKLFAAAQEVSAEPFGVIDAMTTNFNDKGVSIGDDVIVPIAPTRAASDFAAAATPPDGADTQDDSVKVKITRARKVSWRLTGEQIRSLENTGMDTEWVRQLLAQGMRTLRNEAEADAAVAVKIGASRAVGTAGTTPFASDLSALIAARKVLRDNGAPMADLQLVYDTNAEVNLLGLGIVQQAQLAGSDEERRSGRLGRQFGFKLNASAGIALHTKGAGSAYVTGATGPYAAKVRDIPLVTGSGTVLAGDVVTFAADTVNKYVVGTGVAAPGTISLGRPGLRVQVANGNALTIGNSYVPNLAFERGAVVAAMRPPIFPSNPTIKQRVVTDGKGLSYLFLEIDQYGQRTWELHLAWGFQVVQGEHVAIIMG